MNDDKPSGDADNRSAADLAGTQRFKRITGAR
jgi:hypothetical protein